MNSEQDAHGKVILEGKRLSLTTLQALSTENALMVDTKTHEKIFLGKTHREK